MKLHKFLISFHLLSHYQAGWRRSTPLHLTANWSIAALLLVPLGAALRSN